MPNETQETTDKLQDMSLEEVRLYYYYYCKTCSFSSKKQNNLQ